MNGYWLTAIVGGTALWGVAHWLWLSLLAEDEITRKELHRAGHPCQTLRRYQR